MVWPFSVVHCKHVLVFSTVFCCRYLWPEDRNRIHRTHAWGGRGVRHLWPEVVSIVNQNYF
jgi:hypothetical protein